MSDPGVYTIKAERNGCSRDMTGSKTITIFSNPIIGFTPAYSSPPNQCGSVTFTPTVSYPPPPSPIPATSWLYNWTFGTTSVPPNSTIQNPTCLFPAYGTGSQNFPVSIAITDNNGCAGTYTNDITVLQRPDALVEPSNLLWNNCSSTPFTLTIVNKSTTAAINTGYIIDWDDPNPLVETLTPIQFPFNGSWSHPYNLPGTFHLKVTATGPVPNGCNDTKIYPVFNGSTPTGGLTYDAGALQGCKPHTITFKLDEEAQNNAPTTFYYFDFGDNSPVYSFTQETMPPLDPIDGKYHITHTYNTASCSEPGQSFKLTHYIANPCSTIPNDVGF